MTAIPIAAATRRVLGASALCVALLLGAVAAAAPAGGWGPYQQLIGTTWTAPDGFPRKAWRPSADGQEILELEQADPNGKVRVTTIKPNKKGDTLVAIGPDGARRKAKFNADGSVTWTREGMGEGGERIAFKGGAVVVQEQKQETRFAPSGDTGWVEQALAGGAGPGGGKGGGKGKKRSPLEELIAGTKHGKKPPAMPPVVAPAPAYPPPPAYTPPVEPTPSPAPQADAGMSLDCMMAPPEVRARGCKPASATPTPAPGTAGPATTAGAVQVLEVDGQRLPVTRSFPANILGTYYYEKKGEPIIELRGDGSGRFQAHMIAPIQIRWWLKASGDGAPEKITGYGGNYRYTVVLQYVNSTNGNYPSGRYDSWYLDTDVAAGCSIILGERFKCR